MDFCSSAVFSFIVQCSTLCDFAHVLQFLSILYWHFPKVEDPIGTTGCTNWSAARDTTVKLSEYHHYISRYKRSVLLASFFFLFLFFFFSFFLLLLSKILSAFRPVYFLVLYCFCEAGSLKKIQIICKP